MKQRIITAVVAVCILIPILILADYPLFPVAVAICSVIAVFEMLSCLGLKKSVAVSAPFYLSAVAFPFLVRFLMSEKELVRSIAFAAIILGMLYLFAVSVFSHGKYTVQQIGSAFFANLYILFGFNGIIVVHDWVDGGEYLYLVVFLGAWITDIFAYFCGILLGRGGKHKLIPDVSPKKTVEGSIGGIVFCVLAMILFGVIVEAIEPSITANLWIFALGGVFASVVAQVGDLSMSVIKRSCGIKDYGKLFPGHGGMLDRFDSVIAVSAVLTALTLFLNFFERI